MLLKESDPAMTFLPVIRARMIVFHNIIHIYSGFTSGRVLNGELLYTKILEVNLFAFKRPQ